LRIPASLRIKFIREAIKKGLKVLTYDIETSHMLVRSFYIGQKVFLSHNQVKIPNKVITIQYKWMHEKEAKYLQWDKVCTKYDDTRNFDDSSMIEEFIENVFSRADIIVTQNGDRFDCLVLNERAKALHLLTLDQKPSIDILKLSRKSFRAASHKLDYRSVQQGLGGKIKMVDDDWVDVEERGVSARKKMIPYGLKDTMDTEKLMWKELPYYKDLPVAVERVILSFLPHYTSRPEKVKKVKIRCELCRARHRLSTNVKKSNVGFKCLTCNNRWK